MSNIAMGLEEGRAGARGPKTGGVLDAIERGVGMVLERQRADGSWDERGDMGPITTALTLVSLHHLGQLTTEDFAEGARFLRANQREDGAFRGRPFAGEGDLSATAAGWAALHLSPRPEDRDAASRARAYVEAHGGVDAVVELTSEGDISALLLAMAGLLDANRIPSVPLSVVLVPRLIELLSQRVAFFAITGMLQVSAIVRGLRGQPAQRGFFRSVLGDQENARVVQLLTMYQNRSGSLMNVVYYTALLLPALHAMGVPVTDPRIANGVAWLRSRGLRGEHGLHFDVYGSDVWSTASYLRVLLACRVPRGSDAVVRAVSWLLDQQCTAPHPALTNRKPGAPRTGGWGFQSNEDAYPDCDTTSAVTDALGRALVAPSPTDPPLPAQLATRVCASIAAARAWLLGMQNPDGGWPSFMWGHPSKPQGPIMCRPMRMRLPDHPTRDPATWMRALAAEAECLADPSTEDVTSRVLTALAHTGSTLRSPEIEPALAFLRSQQCPPGAWWGRWKVNYLPATACVVSALAHLGDDLARAETQRAIRWMMSRQNDDGGFGESVDSYRDPSLAGCGPSTAPLTGGVLLGLMEGGMSATPQAARAAEYLVRTQNAEGSWPNGDHVATLMPPKLFYVYEGAARYIPLEALALYAERAAR